MSSEFKIMLSRINAANNAQQGYINKVKEYNRGIQELKSNIEKIVIPTEEAKAKAAAQIKQEQIKQEQSKTKSDADKVKEEEILKKETEKFSNISSGQVNSIINKLTLVLKDQFGNLPLIETLNKLHKERRVDSYKVAEALIELHDSHNISNDTSKKILEELTGQEDVYREVKDDLNEFRVLFGDEPTTHIEKVGVKEKDISLRKTLNEIKKGLDAANINAKTSADVLKDIQEKGVITHETQKELHKEMIENANTHGEEVKKLIETLNDRTISVSDSRTDPPTYDEATVKQIDDDIDSIRNKNFDNIVGRDKVYGLLKDVDVSGATKFRIGDKNVKLEYGSNAVNLEIGERTDNSN